MTSLEITLYSIALVGYVIAVGLAMHNIVNYIFL